MRKLSFVLVAVLLLATIALAAPKLETIGACTDPAVADAVKKALAPQGYKVTLDNGDTITLWPAAQVKQAAKGREDVIYQLTPSQFVGVVHFDKNTKDYRGDAIQAGTYNLRYEIQPSDGDHLGTAPTVDFLLAVPAAADTDPNATYNFDQMVGLSRQATGKKHPAPFNLMPPDAKQFPTVTVDNEAHTILSFKVKSQSGDIPFALVVNGTTTE
jgi:hypothetical protein